MQNADRVRVADQPLHRAPRDGVERVADDVGLEGLGPPARGDEVGGGVARGKVPVVPDAPEELRLDQEDRAVGEACRCRQPVEAARYPLGVYAEEPAAACRAAFKLSIVRPRPRSRGVSASKPISSRARLTSRYRLGWPSGRSASQTVFPWKPAAAAISSASSRIRVSVPVPMFTGSEVSRRSALRISARAASST